MPNEVRTIAQYVEYLDAWEPKHRREIPRTPRKIDFVGDGDPWGLWWAAINRRNIKFRQGMH